MERCIWCLWTNAWVSLLQITEMTFPHLEQSAQEADMGCFQLCRVTVCSSGPQALSDRLLSSPDYWHRVDLRSDSPLRRAHTGMTAVSEKIGEHQVPHIHEAFGATMGHRHQRRSGLWQTQTWSSAAVQPWITWLVSAERFFWGGTEVMTLTWKQFALQGHVYGNPRAFTLVPRVLLPQLSYQ